MKSTDEIVMEYYNNRAELVENKKLIADLLNNARIDISEFRDDFYGMDDDYVSIHEWKGWVHALNCCDCEPASEDEYKMAALLDEKKAINIKCGDIKRAIWARGKLLSKVK